MAWDPCPGRQEKAVSPGSSLDCLRQRQEGDRQRSPGRLITEPLFPVCKRAPPAPGEPAETQPRALAGQQRASQPPAELLAATICQPAAPRRGAAEATGGIWLFS